MVAHRLLQVADEAARMGRLERLYLLWRLKRGCHQQILFSAKAYVKEVIMRITEKVAKFLSDAQKLYWIKLFLLCNGMRVDNWQHAGMRRAGPSTGIELVLMAGQSRINVKVPRYTSRITPAKLQNDEVWIDGKMVCHADIMPTPGWYDTKVGNYPISQVLNAHGKFLVTSVYEQCVLFSTKTACVFCSMNQSLQSSDLLLKKPELIVGALELALPGNSYHGLILNGGMMFDQSGGIKNYVPIVDVVRAKFPNLPITVESTPPKDLTWIKRLADVGVSSLTMNMETWDPTMRKVIIPGKHLFYALDDYYRAFEASIALLGKGNVSSCMVFGTEPLETTLQGVQEITSRGVIVSPIARRYYDDIPSFQDGPNPDYEEFAQVLQYAKMCHQKNGLAALFGCQKCNMCDPIGDI
ncbi:hypothetical protein A3I95_00270 [Candidatus Nomurabacteria bacterium RIFCSPLOWO2_02_FULL_44_12]|uniref:Radical SAM core domain-containing protein n=1 Tax=Candidatus Nomurabacteria bacterium RIFCSPLOWO2_12_FULL_44_11 TaxID=1801796 RepID=A0A1F6Y598_9BACT|nr:MAG: hypothetical protein A3E95_03220 [Candidatus Nomurabacteria bacterium RIFCSPHIGHO2_12_FULL_44_22b]OGJ01506.1 MAG: hypothetical protein A3G53_00110 [Candidatus Nomurabacteria bacterium RIFCSPLOWO2_12_FULL_44_11]OGJ07868.1 MAG: hypothetical protein A3I95_00270 [Candidatus Nomurabacteria bacterium RIFCSPLOWO2_02_FULL_44_12]